MIGFIVPPLPFILEVQIDYGIWYALIRECLPGFDDNWIQFAVQELSPASVQFVLRQEQLGDLGMIRLLNVGQGLCELHADCPKEPWSGPEDLQGIQEATKALGPHPDREKLLDTINNTKKQQRLARGQRLRRKLQHKNKVLQGMFSRLEHFPAWQDAIQGNTEEPEGGAAPPTMKGRGVAGEQTSSNPSPLDPGRLQWAKAYHEAEYSRKQDIVRESRVTQRTLQRWVDRAKHNGQL